MKQDKGLTLVALVIIIIILLILAGLVISLAVGNGGFIDQATTSESSFNQSEVLEAIKNLTATKYLEIYDNNLDSDLENQYNTDILLQYFADDERKIIDSYEEDASTNAIESKDENSGYIYYSINIDNLKRNVNKYGSGNWEDGDVYAIRREYTIDAEGNKTYSEDLDVVYKDVASSDEEITVIGNIDVNNPVK